MKTICKIWVLLLATSMFLPIWSAAQKVEWLMDLRADETLLSAKLSAAERRQIIAQLESTSFDVPDAWETELRARRISLGARDGLLIRGTHLLCGGTGNCETWIFRQAQGKWLNMFEDEAPVVSGFGFTQHTRGGIRDFLVSVHNSATSETRMLFKFDGKTYRRTECKGVPADCVENTRPSENGRA